MSNLELMWNLEKINSIIETIKIFFIIPFTIYFFCRMINIKHIKNSYFFILIIVNICTSLIFIKVKKHIGTYCSFTLLVFIMTFINSVLFKKKIGYSILVTVVSFSISYLLYIISVMIAFIPNAFFKIENDYLAMNIILSIYFILIYYMLRIKKIKNGVIFFQKRLENSFFNIIILNIGVTILSLIIMLQNYQMIRTSKVGVTIITLAIIMFFTIKQSFELYYKQNLLTKDLEETKKELENKNKEIAKLERENLEFSKTSHSLAHKQKALEFKLEQLMKTGIDAESKETIKEEIEKVSKELYKEPKEAELAKTEIESIDNMFSYMQSECIKNNIKFELQVVGNIYYMINNLITENDLEILIADHIKDAIIAINNSDNLNRSILVRIGKIDNVYSLYIYDSGIEFTKEVLDNLGKKPITTHADTGGTGMGFMNTFDTLNKTKASLIINEIGNPCEDNYTKVLIFKFDNQNEFKVNSYKNEVVV